MSWYRLASRIAVLVAVCSAAAGAQNPPPLAESEIIGTGTPGATGIPGLRLLGRAAIGEPGPGLRIEGGLPGARALLIVGPGVGSLPLTAYGATLYAQLPATRLSVGPLDGQGHSSWLNSGPAPLQAALMGLEFVAQGMVVDSAAQGGAAFTPGLRLRCGAGFAAAGLFAGLGYRLDPEPQSNLDPVLAAGDFDGDGRPDLLATVHATSSGKLRLLRQLDDGSFAPPLAHTLPAGTVHDLLPADLDGDSHLDLLVSEHVGSSVSEVRLLHGLGDGRFGAEAVIDVPAPAAPCSLALGELTGDGIEDLAVTEWGSGVLAVLPGITGAPQLVTVPGTTAPGTLRALDLDGDAVTDLAMLLDAPVHALLVYRGLAGGGFLPFQTTPIGFSDSLSLTFGDLDGDGDLDAVAGLGRPTTPAPAPTLAVLWNDGSAGFTTSVSPPLSYFTGNPASDVELADLDRDGDLDLVVGHRAELFDITKVLVLRNLGAGVLADGESLLGLASKAVVGDFDGDGLADLAGLSQVAFDPAVVAVWKGLGDGGFDAPPALPGMEVGTACAADLDADGDLDLVGTQLEAQSLLPLVSVSFWSSPAGFGPPISSDAGGSVSLYDGLHVADADGDQLPDVAAAGGGTLRLLHGDGAGGLTATFTLPVTLARTPRIADVDGDSRADLVVSAGSTGLHVLLGQPGGGFAAAVVTPTSPASSVWRYELGRLDGDELLDAAVQGTGGFHVFHGTGGGHFVPSFVPDPGSGPAQEQPIALADFDGDGDLDLARNDFNLQLTVWRNDGTGAFTQGQSQVSSSWFPVVGADVNGDGALDLLGNELWLGFGDGSFAPAVPNFGTGAVGDFDGDGDVDSFLAGYLFFNRVE